MNTTYASNEGLLGSAKHWAKTWKLDVDEV